MGRSPCCDKPGLKKGPWTPEEDQKLLAYIEEHGHGSWRSLPANAGLERCGKSCRLRWINYLRPDIKRGKFTLQEEQTIIQLHALLGNRWSAIATHLPKRTDNEIKNYWNTHLKKRLMKMGIDPVTHKPKNETLLMNNGQSKDAANLSHMAQWESARLEAEARLVREAKLRSHLANRSTDVLKTSWSSILHPKNDVELICGSLDHGLTKTASAWSLESEQHNDVEFMGTSSGSSDTINDEYHDQNHSCNNDEDLPESCKGNIDNSLDLGSVLLLDNAGNEGGEEGFTGFPSNDSVHRSLSGEGKEYSDHSYGSGYYEETKNYWNSILELVNSSPSDSPMF